MLAQQAGQVPTPAPSLRGPAPTCGGSRAERRRSVKRASAIRPGQPAAGRVALEQAAAAKQIAHEDVRSVRGRSPARRRWRRRAALDLARIDPDNCDPAPLRRPVEREVGASVRLSPPAPS